MGAYVFNLCAWQSFYALSNMCIVNVDNFAQDIFSHILRSALNAKKLDASENFYHNKTNIINWYVRENLTLQICLLGLDV